MLDPRAEIEELPFDVLIPSADLVGAVDEARPVRHQRGQNQRRARPQVADLDLRAVERCGPLDRGVVAVADLEAALALSNGLPPFETARVQLALGKASTGPRAVELVKAAATGFATSTLPLCQRNLAVAKAWLAAH